MFEKHVLTILKNYWFKKSYPQVRLRVLKIDDDIAIQAINNKAYWEAQNTRHFFLGLPNKMY